jgi:soluble lytic murein transglycosylase-like protein
MTKRILPLFLLFFATLPCARAQSDASQAERCVRRYAAHYRVPPELIAALIDVESRWNPRAVSDKGAMGLMQLMPATARRYGANHPFDVEENIAAGTRYVTALMWEFHGDMRLVSAAYYAGDRWIAEKRLNYNNPDVVAYVEAVRVKYTMRKRASTGVRRRKE